jgi:hypothetical protein
MLATAVSDEGEEDQCLPDRVMHPARAALLDYLLGQLHRLIQVSILRRQRAEEDSTHAGSDALAELLGQLQALTEAPFRFRRVTQRPSKPEQGRSLTHGQLFGPIDGPCLVEPVE